MTSLVEFLEEITARAEDEEDQRQLENQLDLLGHHRIIKDRTNPLEDLSEKECRYFHKIMRIASLCLLASFSLAQFSKVFCMHSGVVIRLQKLCVFKFNVSLKQV